MIRVVSLQVEDGEQEDNAEERTIRKTDEHVGRIYSALLPDSLLVVCSCQGDTPSTRILYVSSSLSTLLPRASCEELRINGIIVMGTIAFAYDVQN